MSGNQPCISHTSIFIAMGYSWSFTWFRKVLDQAGIDRNQFIQDQIALSDDSWTVQSLSAIFNEPLQTILVDQYFYYVCDHDISLQTLKCSGGQD